MNNTPKPICKKCADKKNLEPMAGGFLPGEPCSECGSLEGTQFTDLMKEKGKKPEWK